MKPSITKERFDQLSEYNKKAWIWGCMGEIPVAPDKPSWIFHPDTDCAIQFTPTTGRDIRDIRCTTYQQGQDELKKWQACHIDVN